MIKEKSVARSTVVCSGKERVKHVYLSSNNSIEVSVVGDRPSKELRYFLLKYEGELVLFIHSFIGNHFTDFFLHYL